MSCNDLFKKRTDPLILSGKIKISEQSFQPCCSPVCTGICVLRCHHLVGVAPSPDEILLRIRQTGKDPVHSLGLRFRTDIFHTQGMKPSGRSVMNERNMLPNQQFINGVPDKSKFHRAFLFDLMQRHLLSFR